MRTLEYILFKKGDPYFGKKVVAIENKRHYVFSPTADVPDGDADKILANLKNEFREVTGAKAPEPEKITKTFKCDACEFVGKNQLSVNAHKRHKHKEKQNV